MGSLSDDVACKMRFVELFLCTEGKGVKGGVKASGKEVWWFKRLHINPRNPPFFNLMLLLSSVLGELGSACRMSHD